MLRWLTSDVPNRVVVTLPTDQANPKNPIAIRASVADSMFIARNDAKVVAHLTSDSGVEARSAARLGDRSRRRVSRNVHARSSRASTRCASTRRFRTAASPATRRYVRVADLNTEYFDAEMRAPLLKRMASETGGQVLHAGDGEHACRGRRAEQARRDGRESDGSVGHAGDLPAARRAGDGGVGVSQSARAGMSGGKREAGSGNAGRDWRVRALLASVRRCSRFPLPASRFRLRRISSSSAGWAARRSTRDSFAKISQALADAAAKRFGIPDAEIQWFGEDSVSKQPHYRGQSTKVERRARDRRSSRRAPAPAIRSSSCSSATAAATARRRRSAFPVPI